MPRVVHFEIFGDKLKHLISFYEQVFGGKFEKWGPIDYWIIKTGEGPGIDGGLGIQRSPGTITIDVPDVDEAVDSIQRAGGHRCTENDAAEYRLSRIFQRFPR